jgi:hypothetical protein
MRLPQTRQRFEHVGSVKPSYNAPIGECKEGLAVTRRSISARRRAVYDAV